MQAPEPMRDRLRRLTTTAQTAACRRLRVPAGPDREALRSDPRLVLDQAEHRSRLACMRRLAHRIAGLTTEIDDAETDILDVVRALDPGLLAEIGVGPITPAQILISWSHPGRLKSRPPSPP